MKLSDQKLKEHLKANAAWVKNSFDHNGGAGSSAYRTLLGRWADAYPETTGYLLPTLCNISLILHDDYWHELAIRQADYFYAIQHESGFFLAQGQNESYVFDNAQILLGLCSIYDLIEGRPVQPEIVKCYHWILSCLTEKGLFDRNTYTLDYNPAYYSRIVWALLRTEQVFGLEPEEKTRRLYQHIKNFQKDNLSFKHVAFAPGEPAFTHTLIYTLRGLWESGILLDDHAMQSRVMQTIRIVDKLIVENKGKMAGDYNEQWVGDYSYTCLTGVCQYLILKELIYKQSKDSAILEHSESLLEKVIRSQRSNGKNKGAIPSSVPVFGKYQRLKFTNWTQKFFLDLLLLKLDQSGSMRMA